MVKVNPLTLASLIRTVLIVVLLYTFAIAKSLQLVSDFWLWQTQDFWSGPLAHQGEMPMNGNVSTVEGLKQCAELLGAVAKAMALAAPSMSKAQRQVVVGMPSSELASVLEQALRLLPSKAKQPLLGHNSHGHRVLQLTRQNLTGEQVIEHANQRGKKVSGRAIDCLLSKTKKSFNNRPQLASGLTYEIALVPVREIVNLCEDYEAALVQKALEEYGYHLPPVDVLPLLFCQFSERQLFGLGFSYFGAVHEPVVNVQRQPDQFCLSVPKFGAGQGKVTLHANGKAASRVCNVGSDGVLVFVTN